MSDTEVWAEPHALWRAAGAIAGSLPLSASADCRHPLARGPVTHSLLRLHTPPVCGLALPLPLCRRTCAMAFKAHPVNPRSSPYPHSCNLITAAKALFLNDRLQALGPDKIGWLLFS